MKKQNIQIACMAILPFAIFATFLALRLTHLVSWPWWLVWAPLWGPVALFLILILVATVAIRIKYGRHS